jgi:hypothetical protein
MANAKARTNGERSWATCPANGSEQINEHSPQLTIRRLSTPSGQIFGATHYGLTCDMIASGRSSGSLSPRIASRNFVTGCLISDVTGAPPS